MTILRTIELICGIAAGVSLFASFVLLGFADAEGSFKVVEFWFLYWGLPVLLLVVGVCIHGVSRKSWGFVIVFIIAGLSAINIALAVLGGLIGYAGGLRSLYLLIPSIMSAITGVATLMVVLSEKSRPKLLQKNPGGHAA